MTSRAGSGTGPSDPHSASGLMAEGALAVLRERACVVCGEALRGRRRRACSDSHRAALNRLGPDAAQAWYRERHDPARSCEVCGKSLAGKRSDARYCGPFAARGRPGGRLTTSNASVRLPTRLAAMFATTRGATDRKAHEEAAA